MSNQNLGGISWFVDADTSPAVNSTAELGAQVDKVETSLKGLDAQVSKTSKGVSSAASAMSSDFKKSATQVAMDMRNIGYQVTDIGVQLAPILGANGIVLAGIQQFSQIGQIFNPMAAGVFALAGAIAGPYLSSLFDSEDATDKLKESIEALNDIVITSENGVNALSNEYAALAKRSEAAAQSQLLLARVNAQDVLIRTADAASEAITEFDTLFNAMEVAATQGAIVKMDAALAATGMTISQLINETDLYGTGLTQLKSAADQLNDKFGITTEKSIEIIRQFSKFKQDRTTESFSALAETLARVATEAGSNATPEFVKMVASVAKLSVEASTAEDKIKLLNEAIAGSKVPTEKAIDVSERYASLLDRLSVRSEELRSSQLQREKQLTLEKAAEDGVSESMRNSIAVQYDRMIASELAAEAERNKSKALAEEAKKQALIDKRAREEASKQRDAERKQREQERQRDKQSQKLDRFNSMANSAITAAEDDPEVLATIARDTKLEDLRKAYMESDLADSARFAEASKAIWQKYNDDLVSINEHRTMTTLASFQGTFDSLAQVFKDAEGEQSASFRAMFAMSKGFAIAQAGLNLSKAISDALGWGGFTISEKFASMGAVSAAGAGLLSSITSASYGGREHGGTVMANTPYSVGEKNKPELLMIPGSNGKVFSNAEMRSFANGGGGGGAPIVNVHNYAGVPVETRTSQGMTEQQVIDIIIGQTSSGNTRTMKNITRLTSATNNAAANRR